MGVKNKKLKFYEIDKSYLDYLKRYDDKVSNQSYKDNNKFFCGIVLKIGKNNYYAPISHYNRQDQTNFVIKNDEKAIASIRFCFMIPVPKKYLIYKDFSRIADKKYVQLLDIEMEYCRANEEKIMNKALKVYKIGCNDRHPLNKVCCDFKKLEEVQFMYEG